MKMKAMGWCRRLVFFATVLGLAVSASCITNKEPARAENSEPAPPQEGSAPPEQASRGETISITGQMTLADLERDFGISAVEIAKKLGLPPDLAQDETFGRLRQNYSFTMDQVREIAKTKMPDLNANDVDAAMQMVLGTARSMGIEVE